jgi:NAD(P)-dependent dehydrogenase (short-subunit alcohol dehydrogenase family)
VSFYCSTKWAVSGLTESVREELAPFGINVTCIEPGYFRTGFLNDGRKFGVANKIQAYEDSVVGQVRAFLAQTNNNQPGDVLKGAKAIVDVLTQSGAAEGREIPLRLVLGTDCLAGVRQKVTSTLELLDEWQDISAATDIETK